MSPSGAFSYLAHKGVGTNRVQVGGGAGTGGALGAERVPWEKWLASLGHASLIYPQALMGLALESNGRVHVQWWRIDAYLPFLLFASGLAFHRSLVDTYSYLMQMLKTTLRNLSR